MGTGASSLWPSDAVHELTWDEFVALADRVRDSIVNSGWMPTAIVAVSRGGLPFGVWMSHRLSLGPERFLPVAATRNLTDERFSERPRHPTIAWSAPLGALRNQDVLIADDIAGDGATLSAVGAVVAESRPRSLRTAVLVSNERGGARPDFLGRTVDQWVVFPWER